MTRDSRVGSAEAVEADDVDGRTESVWRERLPFLALLGYLAVALPLLLLRIGRYRWFYSDEWGMIADRDGDLGSYFEPNNAHWSTLPMLSYRVLWKLFGLNSYLPYQAVLLVLHGAVVVLLWFVLRRCSVHPWLATFASAVLVLYGPGGDDIVWAFQIGFVGSLALGLAHVLLVVDDDVSPRREALGLAAGLGALLCSGVGVTMVAAVAGAALLRRGWKPALLHGGVLGATYLTWTVLADPQSESPSGRPAPADLWIWIWHHLQGVADGVGGYRLVALALVALLVVGLALVVASSSSFTDLRHRLAIPLALGAAAVVFAGITGLGRWHLGFWAAQSSRYVYIGTALLLPLLAVALDAVRRRWSLALVPMLVLLVVAVPTNAGSFEDSVYSRRYFDEHRRIFYAVPRVPFAHDVPADVRPLPNPFVPDSVNVGFLLAVAADGRMPDDGRVAPAVEEEMRVRLGLAQRQGVAIGLGCEVHTEPLRVVATEGQVFALTGPLSVRTVKGRELQSVPVQYAPRHGRQLTVELATLDLIVAPAFGSKSFRWCPPT